MFRYFYYFRLLNKLKVALGNLSIFNYDFNGINDIDTKMHYTGSLIDNTG